MNPHFFFSLLAPRLPHVMQGAEDTGCEVHDGRAGEESSGGVQLPRGVRFLQTVHQDADDISAALEHFVLVQEELDVETFQAVRQLTLSHDVLLELQNEAKFELAFPRRERRRGRPPDPARLGSSVCFAPQKIRHLSRPQSLCRTTPSKKKSCDAVRALPPLNCICVGPPH